MRVSFLGFTWGLPGVSLGVHLGCIWGTSQKGLFPAAAEYALASEEVCMMLLERSVKTNQVQLLPKIRSLQASLSPSQLELP